MSIEIRPLADVDVLAAERVFRLAFGTFLGVPDPLTFSGDCGYVHTRWRIEPRGAIAAFSGGELVGSNFASRWGRFGFFGPLSVRPDLQDRGVARQLLDATMRRFDDWGIGAAGLFTFPQSAKHIGLYLSYGFYPRFLTAVMAKAVGASAVLQPAACASMLGAAQRESALAACRALCDTLHAGLDLSGESHAAQVHGLGDTLLLYDGDALSGFAVCHVGPGTEAGSGVCYVKFGCVAAPARRIALRDCWPCASVLPRCAARPRSSPARTRRANRPTVPCWPRATARSFKASPCRGPTPPGSVIPTHG